MKSRNESVNSWGTRHLVGRNACKIAGIIIVSINRVVELSHCVKEGTLKFYGAVGEEVVGVAHPITEVALNHRDRRATINICVVCGFNGEPAQIRVVRGDHPDVRDIRPRIV